MFNSDILIHSLFFETHSLAIRTQLVPYCCDDVLRSIVMKLGQFMVFFRRLRTHPTLTVGLRYTSLHKLAADIYAETATLRTWCYMLTMEVSLQVTRGTPPNSSQRPLFFMAVWVYLRWLQHAGLPAGIKTSLDGVQRTGPLRYGYNATIRLLTYRNNNGANTEHPLNWALAGGGTGEVGRGEEVQEVKETEAGSKLRRPATRCT